eukprot:3603046-Amphidinium_carterae.1
MTDDGQIESRMLLTGDSKVTEPDASARRVLAEYAVPSVGFAHALSVASFAITPSQPMQRQQPFKAKSCAIYYSMTHDKSQEGTI